MSLQTWDRFKKEANMQNAVQKTVQITLNIGANDLLRLGINDAYREGEVVTLDEKVASGLIRNRFAREWDAKAQHEEAERLKRDSEAAVAAATPNAARELAQQAAKEEATRRVKAGGPLKAAVTRPDLSPEEFIHNPHDAKK